MKKLNVKLPQGGSKRALHSGMYASALAVVVLAVTILVNLVIRALPTNTPSTIFPRRRFSH